MDNFNSVCTLQFGIMYLGTIDYRVLILEFKFFGISYD